MTETIRWGGYVLLPHPLKFKDSPVVGGVAPPDVDLLQENLGDSPLAIRGRQVADLPGPLRAKMRLPAFIPWVDAEVSGAWMLPGGSCDCGVFATDVFWHRPESRLLEDAGDPRNTADLEIIRTRGLAPPLLYQYGSPREPDGITLKWDITPIKVRGEAGLFHEFVQNPLWAGSEHRWRKTPNAVEWLEPADSIRSAVMGWDLSVDELTKVAESLP